MTFTQWFRQFSDYSPYPWQADLGGDGAVANRLVRIPTGMGKTLGVLGPWLWHRVVNQNADWPRRLVWCLPMRVLVEQTEQEARRRIQRLGLLWDSQGDHRGKVGLHVVMGGVDSGEWSLHPEACAVLIGTQDMLLSRALNRGYASPRARWPMEFGLLNQDCLWIMDEVQLMDVGLATSAQLQAFRDQASRRSGSDACPCKTWWMSATLRQEWLEKSPDTTDLAQEAKAASVLISPEARKGKLWEGVTKPLRVEAVKDTKALAQVAADAHRAIPLDGPRVSLVVLNTVERAMQVADELMARKVSPDIKVVHSRFRPHERRTWASFLTRDTCESAGDRILVSTQVVEAGVDISARVLVTELAPWPSLVQRFGRVARWGGAAQVIVANLGLSPKHTAPYDETELQAALAALQKLEDVAPVSLERFEEDHPELAASLYPYEPRHLLLAHEVDQLFDTTPDLTGADVDVSRFIRSGEERDCLVFWDRIPPNADPPGSIGPCREALCPAPFVKVQTWLCGDKGAGLLKGKRAWVWDWLDGRWRRAARRDIWPGQTLLVDSACGGYDPVRGWSPDCQREVTPITMTLSPEFLADEAQDGEALSANDWCTIATHGLRVAGEAADLARQVAPGLARRFHLAGRWHDIGKAHPAFQGCLSDSNGRTDWAKAPDTIWRKGRALYPMPDGAHRPGFRHELAGALALFDVLRRHRPDHAALLGPWRDLLEQAGMKPELEPRAGHPPNAVEQEILDLSADDFNLLAYLVGSHHGKVRLSLHACPADQEAADERLRIRGIRDGESLPAVPVMDQQDRTVTVPEAVLDLAPSALGLSPRTGCGWTERTLGLLNAFGPFRLAWFEACFRAADIRASRRGAPDALLQPGPSVGEAKRSQTPEPVP